MDQITLRYRLSAIANEIIGERRNKKGNYNKITYLLYSKQTMLAGNQTLNATKLSIAAHFFVSKV